MKYALVCPHQPTEEGFRICQVEDKPFKVAPPLIWIKCADDVIPDNHWYHSKTRKIISPKPLPKREKPIATIIIPKGAPPIDVA